MQVLGELDLPQANQAVPPRQVELDLNYNTMQQMGLTDDDVAWQRDMSPNQMLQQITADQARRNSFAYLYGYDDTVFRLLLLALMALLLLITLKVVLCCCLNSRKRKEKQK